MSDFLARIKPKRSTVAGEKPSALDLQVAEIALNTADGKIFTKHTDGTIKEISGSGGGGGGSINAIEEIGNVAPRQSVAPGVLSWDVPVDPFVLGGWDYDSETQSLLLYKEAKNGFDIRPSVVAMPTTGTVWISFDNASYTEVAYLSKSIDTDVVSLGLVVSVPDDGEVAASEIWVAFESPFADGASFDNDILLYDVSENVWKPTPYEVNRAIDWDVETTIPTAGQTMVWNEVDGKWEPGFPILSVSGNGGAVSQIVNIGTGYLLGPANRYADTGTATADGWTNLSLTGDDSVWGLTVPVGLRGTEFFGQTIPSTIYFCSNGNVHWDASLAGDSGGRNGNVLQDSGGRDFWLGFWSQDTSSSATYERWDGATWTIRAEFSIPYNQPGTGCPVELALKTDGSIRVSYGNNTSSTSIIFSETHNGIVSDGEWLVEGWNSSQSEEFTWSAIPGGDIGRTTSDLADVGGTLPTAGQVLTFTEAGIYVPTDLPTSPVASVNTQTGDVSIGVEELADYSPAEIPALVGRWSVLSPASTTQNGVIAAGWTNSRCGGRAIDADGVDHTASFALIEDGDPARVSIDGGTVWIETTWITAPEDQASQGSAGFYYFDLGADVYAAVGSVPNDTDVLIEILPIRSAPLAEGDIVRYDGTEFRPVPLELNALLDVDTESAAPLNDQALAWDDLAKKWRPLTLGGAGGGGAIDTDAPADGTPYVRQDLAWTSLQAVQSINGNSGEITLGLGGLDDVTTQNVAPAGFETGFELNDPLVSDPDGTYSQIEFYEGSRSLQFSTGEATYGSGTHLKNVFEGNDGPRYDVVRLYIKSDAVFDTNNRLSLGGTKNEIDSGLPGWTVYTRDTGFSFFMNGYEELGVKPDMQPGVWYEIIYVLDWANGRDQKPAAVSLWVDGAICVVNESLGSGVTYAAPTDPDDRRMYFAFSSGNATANRWVDKIQVKSVETLPWLMVDDGINIDSFFAATTTPPDNLQILQYDGSDQQWKPGDFDLQSVQNSGYSLYDVDQDPAKPYSRLHPTSLGQIRFDAYTVKDAEQWSLYANQAYGMTIGTYHLDPDDGGTISDERLRANEARRTYYSARGIIHNLGDKPLWLNGALGDYTDNTPELRWTSGNPGDSGSANNGNYVGLKLPSALDTDMTYTFPSVAPDGRQYLSGTTDGDLEWVDPVILTNTNPFSISADVLQNFESDGADLPVRTANMTTTFPSADAKFGTGGATFSRANADYYDLALATQIGVKLFTLEFWYKSTDADYASGSFRRIIAPQGGLNQTTGFQVYKRTTTAGKEGHISLDPDGNLECASTNQAIDDGQWHHIVFQHLGVGLYTCHLDGVEVSRIQRDAPIDFAVLGGWRIGGRNDLDENAFFDGSLDGIALYLNANRYLSNFNVPTEPPTRDVILAGGAVLTTITELADVDTETTTPLDGQALVWDNSEQLWKPGSVSGGSGGINNIQEAGDFELNASIPSASIFRYDSVIPSGTCEEMVTAITTWESKAILGPQSIDVSTGQVAVDFGTTLQGWTGFEFSTAGIEGPWTSTGVVTTGADEYGCGGVSFYYDIAADISNAQTVWVREIGSADPQVIPLAEGDVLRWVDAYQAFKPAQIPTPFSGSYNDLTDVPADADTKRIQDQEDFGLNLPLNGPTYNVEYINGQSTPQPGYLIPWSDSGLMFFDELDSNGIDRVDQLLAMQVGDPVIVSLVSDPSVTYEGEVIEPAPYTATGRIIVYTNIVGLRSGYEIGELYSVASPALGTAYIPLAEGDILQWVDDDQQFKPARLPVVGPQRQTEAVTATGATDNTSYDVEIEGLGNAGTFLQVTTSHAAWVRFYTDSDARTADVRTDSTESPTRGDGVLLELITTGAETYKATPAVGYFNLTDGLDRKLYARVTNLSGATADVTVTVNALVLEA